MGYTEQDWKAINTIRLLAVSFILPARFYPATVVVEICLSTPPLPAHWRWHDEDCSQPRNRHREKQLHRSYG